MSDFAYPEESRDASQTQRRDNYSPYSRGGAGRGGYGERAGRGGYNAGSRGSNRGNYRRDSGRGGGFRSGPRDSRREGDNFGTELDRVNCSFYLKIGACRHADKCSRTHTKPRVSQTILLPNMFDINSDDATFEAFYEDLFCEAARFGYVEQLVVANNACDHLIGNVYIKFEKAQDAAKCRDNFDSRWYNKLPVYCELSPVSKFGEACCKQDATDVCKRGDDCNFIHPRMPSAELLESLRQSQEKSRENGSRGHNAHGPRYHR